jgi:adenosine deaminase
LSTTGQSDEQETTNGPEQPRIKASKALASTIDALARQFHDASIRSSIQRAANIMTNAQLTEQQMLDLIQEAREETNQCQVQKRNGKHINRMPYFFKLLQVKASLVENGLMDV